MVTLRTLAPLIDDLNQLSVRDFHTHETLSVLDPSDYDCDEYTLDEMIYKTCGDYLDYEVVSIEPRAHHLVVNIDVLGGAVRA